MSDQTTTPDEAAQAAALAAAQAAAAAPVVTQDGGAPAIDAPAAPEVKPVKHEETGNPAIDLALDFIGNLGIGPSDPAVVAARAGDFAQIEARFKDMGDKAKGWQRHLALVKDVYNREQDAAKSQGATILKEVSDAVGGTERWKMIAAWAGTEATPAQKAQVNAALAAGGLAAKAVAKELAAQFDRRVGKAGNSPIKPGAASAASDGTAPITGKDYGRAVAELSARHPGKDITKMPEYTALRTRRQASLRSGVR